MPPNEFDDEMNIPRQEGPPNEFGSSSTGSGPVGLDTPVLARAIRAATGEEYEDRGLVAATTHWVWQIIQAVTPHHLWLHRNAAAFQDRTDSVHGIAAKIWTAVINQVSSYAAAKRVSSDTYLEGCIIDDIVRGIQADDPTEGGDLGEVRLYYDGGARGNAGPSGAGSVLLERAGPTAPWLIVWWAATYLGPASTNYAAVHATLAQGLEEATRRYRVSNTTIDIVGDSMLATRQLQDEVRTTSRKFTSPLHRSRSALIQLYNYRLHHTLRTGNKGADWLANHAMNTQLTSTSMTAPRTTATAIRDQLYRWTATDTAHEWTLQQPTTDAVTRIGALLRVHSPTTSPSPRKRPRPIGPRAPTRNIRSR